MVASALQNLTRALLVLTLMIVVQPQGLHAADQGFGGGPRAVELGIGKSYVVDLPANAAEVLVADPKIANAVVRSARKAYVIGVALGDTDIIFFDDAGRQIESLAVSVGRDMSSIRNNIRASMPDAVVDASAIGDSVMLTGSVRSPADAATAAEIAANLVGSPDKVVNAIAIENRDQVMLKVSVVEMKREIGKKFGVNWEFTKAGNPSFGAISYPQDLIGSGWERLNPLMPDGLEQLPMGAIGGSYGWGSNLIRAQLQAMERNGLVRTLAEPTLLTISGEKAEFLAGGEFPIPIQSKDGLTVDYKDYGISLSFTPVVLSSGRISLQIATGVSEIDAAVGNICCGLKTRRATTTVELPSGGALSIAGLLQERNAQSLQGLPGLINLPVLGSLFRSRDFQRGQSELVIIVTPYIAKHAPRDKLARPDDGFSTPDDANAILLGQFNRIYAPALAPKGRYMGPIGHIVE